MSENSFIIVSAAYLIMASWLTFSLGPTLITNGRALDKSTLIIENLDRLSIQLEEIKPKIIVNGKEYDSIPLNSSIKFKKNRNKYLKLTFYKDTLVFQSINNTKSESFKNIMTFLEKNNVLTKNNFKEKLKSEITVLNTNFIRKIEVSKEDLVNNVKSLEYLKINNIIVKGRNKEMRVWVMIIAGYIVTILSGLGLLLIPISMYTQIRDYRNSGTKMYVPNKLDGIKSFFNLFTNKRK